MASASAEPVMMNLKWLDKYLLKQRLKSPHSQSSGTNHYSQLSQRERTELMLGVYMHVHYGKNKSVTNLISYFSIDIFLEVHSICW